MHALKIAGEIAGGILAVVVLVAMIVGAMIVHDEESGDNPLQ